jgi:microcystin-dependent protein
MADQFVGEIRCVGFNYPPAGWAFCNGQLLSLSQNTALFSLFGTFYGGDGKSTFALPNLQGNVAISQGSGPGLTPRFIGENGGAQTVTLLQTEMALHNHNYMVDTADGPANRPVADAAASISFGAQAFTTAISPTTPMAANSLPVIGGSQQHNNMMQFLVMNFVVALQGIFPARA